MIKKPVTGKLYNTTVIINIFFRSFNYSPPVSETNLTIIALRKFIPRFMSYSASSLNPILYNFMSGKSKYNDKSIFLLKDKNYLQ